MTELEKQFRILCSLSNLSRENENDKVLEALLKVYKSRFKEAYDLLTFITSENTVATRYVIIAVSPYLDGLYIGERKWNTQYMNDVRIMRFTEIHDLYNKYKNI